MPSCFLECILQSAHPWHLVVKDIGHVTCAQTQLVLSTLQLTLFSAHPKQHVCLQIQPHGVLAARFHTARFT